MLVQNCSQQVKMMGQTAVSHASCRPQPMTNAFYPSNQAASRNILFAAFLFDQKIGTVHIKKGMIRNLRFETTISNLHILIS